MNVSIGLIFSINNIQNKKHVIIYCGVFNPLQNVIKKDSPEEHYRNPFLTTAMLNLQMVESAGGGIKKMFYYQRQRFFPLPEYDLSDNKVKVTITGKVIDSEFANVLAKNINLSLEDIFLLDKVQKKKKLSDIEFNYLKKKTFIEGNKKHPIISSHIIAKTSSEKLKSDYIKQKPFDDKYYMDMIIKYLSKNNAATRNNIDLLLYDKLSETLNPKEKKTKIMNYLSKLRINKRIVNTGTRSRPIWILNQHD